MDTLREVLGDMIALGDQILDEAAHTALGRYAPFLKQKEFHAAGGKYRERLLRAGNQLGKTYAGGAEMAMHLTGLYPCLLYTSPSPRD